MPDEINQVLPSPPPGPPLRILKEGIGFVDRTPARRSTDLPPDAPWWARWIEANVQEAWKWASMRWSAACAIAAEAYAMYPTEIGDAVKQLFPPHWWPHIIAAGFLANMLFRVVRLKPPEKTP